MQPRPHFLQTTLARFIALTAFGLVVFLFGFTDLPLMRDRIFPLFCVFLALLFIPTGARPRRKRPAA